MIFEMSRLEKGNVENEMRRKMNRDTVSVSPVRVRIGESGKSAYNPF